MDVQLAHDAFAMGFHRAHSDAEASGDFLVAQTFGDLDQHFAFASGQVRLITLVGDAAYKLIREYTPKAEPLSKKPPPGPSVSVKIRSASFSVKPGDALAAGAPGGAYVGQVTHAAPGDPNACD